MSTKHIDTLSSLFKEAYEDKIEQLFPHPYKNSILLEELSEEQPSYGYIWGLE